MLFKNLRASKPRRGAIAFSAKDGGASEMKSSPLMFTLGAIVGGALVAVLFFAGFKIPEVVRERDELRRLTVADVERIRELEDGLTKVTESRGKLELANSELATRVQNLSKLADQTSSTSAMPAKASAPPSDANELSKTEDIDKVTHLLGLAGVEMKVEGQLLKLKKCCQLTEAQESTAREIFTRQFDLSKRTGNPKADLLSLLNPEQQAAFKQMQQEERQFRNGSRMLSSAQTELSSLSSDLGLSQEQFDKAWPAFYEYARSQWQDEYLQRSKKKDPAAMLILEEMTKRRLDGLAGVLDKEQHAIYERQQRKYLDALKIMLEIEQ